MKFVALLALVALCVAAVPSMRNRPWRMGKVHPRGSARAHGNSGVASKGNQHPLHEEEVAEPTPKPAVAPARSNRRKGTEGLRPVLQHDVYLGGEEETGRHQLPPFPSIEEKRVGAPVEQPALDEVPDFTMKEMMQRVNQRKQHDQWLKEQQQQHEHDADEHTEHEHLPQHQQLRQLPPRPQDDEYIHASVDGDVDGIISQGNVDDLDHSLYGFPIEGGDHHDADHHSIGDDYGIDHIIDDHHDDSHHDGHDDHDAIADHYGFNHHHHSGHLPDYMSHSRQYQPHTDTIGHELFMMRTPPKFLLCYEGFDNGTTVMQKSCFTLKTDLQCRPLSELNVASSHRRVQSKKHYCMPKTCHSDSDCHTVPNPIGSCRSQHGMRGGIPGLARCKIGCSAILFLAACRVSVGADIILERTCHKRNEICTALFTETLELGNHLMVAHFCHKRDYIRGLTPSPRELFCPPGHRSHQPLPEPFNGEAPIRPQILQRSPHNLHHGPPHVRENHPNHNSNHADQDDHDSSPHQPPPLDYSPIPESVLPSGLIPHATPQQDADRMQYSVPDEKTPDHHYGVPSPLQVHHQIPPPDTHYTPHSHHGYAPPFYGH